MNMEWKTLAPEGRPCLAARVGAHGPAFYWFVSEREAARAQELCCAAAEAVQSPCLLALCVVKDWDRELSPWAAPAVFRGGEDFAGGGASTLKWLQTVCLPAAEEGWQTTARFLCGYSLAGLFCLWGYYESGGAFGGAVVPRVGRIRRAPRGVSRRAAVFEPGGNGRARKEPRPFQGGRCGARTVRAHPGRPKHRLLRAAMAPRRAL